MKLVNRNWAVSAIISTMLPSVPPRLPDRRELRVGNFAARLDERFREGDRSLALGIARAALPVQLDFVRRDFAQVARDEAVRGQAVVTPVRLRHRQRDPVSRLDVQRLRKRSHQGSPAGERVRADRHEAMQVGYEAQQLVDVVEDRLRIRGRVLSFRNGNTWHLTLLVQTGNNHSVGDDAAQSLTPTVSASGGHRTASKTMTRRAAAIMFLDHAIDNRR